MKPWLRALAALVFSTAWVLAPAQRVADAGLAAMLQHREAWFDARGLDLPTVSKEITAAVREGERLEREGRYQEALDQLLQLARYAPFEDFPSFDVHMLAGWLYMKLGNAERAKVHQARASDYRTFLTQRVGSGSTPDDPLRVVMTSELVDWIKMRRGNAVEVKDHPYNGRELTMVRYNGLDTGGQVRTVYFEMDRRMLAMVFRAQDRYAPLDVRAMTAGMKADIETARRKREAFLADRSFSLFELRPAMVDAIKAARELDAQGKPQEALARLRELEKLRPIEDIPTPVLWLDYSYLLGKTGDREGQQRMRGLIFGVQQAMAHSGNALGESTAIEVLFLDEEYDWLAAKKLTRKAQALVTSGERRFDVLTVDAGNGTEVKYYFDITRMYLRQADDLSRKLSR